LCFWTCGDGCRAPGRDLPPLHHAGQRCAGARDAFARFAIESVAARYTVAGGKWSDVAKIVVSGPAKITPPRTQTAIQSRPL
jgi:hypothetical protein